MILLNTKRLCFVFLVLIGMSASSQEDKFNRISVEITTGVHVPFAPVNHISRSNYVGFKQFQLSGRYMLTESFGLKGHYAFNGFSSSKNKNYKISFNRVGLEAVANVGKLLKVDYRLRERLGLLVHSGFGITLAKPSFVDGTDHIGNFLIGLTGQIKLNDNFTLLGDMTYVRSFEQQYSYKGQLINANFDPVSGSFVNVSIGIMYNFGEERYHADWY
ncbi:hypothetical protein [Aequorivita sp. Q41]|uniref:hypothetical protein n=1 Tax=Aequorivita sp. Q41 TaxID=3153300 RepID=UPI003242519C